MINFYHVHKRYGQDIHALADINLSIEKGEFVFITGPSGAGKTTLLRLILREDHPSEGQIVVDGRNITAIPDSKIPFLRRSMGFVFQDFKLIQRKDVLDNVSYILYVAGLSRKEMRQKAYNALRVVGLNHRIHHYPKSLSGGEQQRVAIARAIVSEPRILLADEPTGNLDPELTLEIMELFKEINARGTTILVATHDKNLVAYMKRRTIMLDKGCIVDGEREKK